MMEPDVAASSSSNVWTVYIGAPPDGKAPIVGDYAESDDEDSLLDSKDECTVVCDDDDDSNGNNVNNSNNNSGSRYLTEMRALWESKFQLLVEYNNKHGTSNVPQTKSQLGNWVHTQRSAYKKKKLP